MNSGISRLSAVERSQLWISDLGNTTKYIDNIKLVNEARGIEKVLAVVAQYEYDTVVLLCAEADEKKCHRSYVRDKLAACIKDVMG